VRNPALDVSFFIGENKPFMINIKTYLAILPISAILGFISLFLAIKGQKKRTASALILFLVVTLGVLFGNWAELLSPTPVLSVLSCRITYIFVAFLMPFWILFVHQLKGQPLAKRKRLFCLLSIIPLITITLQFTNDYHHLIWNQYHFERIDGYLINVIDRYGFWFWVHTIYSYSIYFIGAVELIAENLHRWKVYRTRAFLFIFGTTVPIIVNIVYIFHSVSGLRFDISPGVLMVGELCFSIAMTKYSFFDLAPIPQRTLNSLLEIGVTVMNEAGQILEMNDIAMRHFSVRGQIPGVHIDSLLRAQNILAPDLSKLQTQWHGETQGMAVDITPKTVSENTERNTVTFFVMQTALHAIREPEIRAESLTQREKEICALFDKGYSYKELAFELGIKADTLKSHVKNINKKLGTTNMREILDVLRKTDVAEKKQSLEQTVDHPVLTL
jgi:DNA-binding CsgD family transcriptional regulator